MLVNENLAGADVHLDFKRGAVELIKSWRPTQRMIRCDRLSHPAVADQFAGPAPELTRNEFANRQCAVRKAHYTAPYLHFGLGTSKQVRGQLAQLLVDVLASAN